MSRFAPAVRCAVAVLLAAPLVLSQYAERPQLPGSGGPAVDCSGRSIKNKRVRAIHTVDPTEAGGTAYFFERDPFLAYQLGRNLNFREFRDRDGVFDGSVSGLAGPMPDGTTRKITANNQTSCVGCHNLPEGNPGGGANFSKDSGFGRNSPHYYGAGIVEMIALQVRAEMMAQLDQNGDGWVSVREAQAGGTSVLVRSARGGAMIDYGDPSLSNGATGKPRLNNIFRVWYVDQNGRVAKDATQVNGTTAVGYNFEMMVWGWGQGPGRSALNPTNRAFLWDPYKTHSGLEAYDPSTTDDPDGNGVSEPTLAGAIQFPVTHRAADAGKNLHRLGFSLDDPDDDGHLNEISEGDLDLAEWFMLNAPRPAFRGTPGDYAAGVAQLSRMGCVECHVPDWELKEKSSDHDGDRRFFDLNVQWNQRNGRLEGHVRSLYDMRGGSYVRRLGSFAARGVFSDFRQHDMGPDLEEIDFGGTVNTVWRTAPLWGVGSGFPWGHDGHSLSLEDIIARHGGEADASRQAWRRSSPRQREALLGFLRSLVLYDIETLPTDVDGDGAISNNFRVAGMDTGVERFNAEWLFQNPLRIQGPFVNIHGITVTSFAGMNVDEAYGQGLLLRRDTDDDGWPDVWDVAPTVPGYRNGSE